MKAGRHNIGIPDELPDQCEACLTLKDDDGNRLYTLRCSKPTHNPHTGHKYIVEWNDVFSDKPLIPDPPNMRIVRSQDDGIVAAIPPKDEP
jgi:hypothetical protein